MESISHYSTAPQIPSQGFDAAQSEAFAARMQETLNAGALALMTSIGHRTGLFDTLAGFDSATAHQIAKTAALSERYVQEWLNAMVVGKVVMFDPERQAYHLPAEHAAVLTRAAAPNNLAAFTQYIGLLGSVEDSIVACFREGGGVPYEEFHRFHEVMAEDSGQTVLPVLLDTILPLAPGLIGKLESGIDVLDLGCGAGRALNLMAEAFPNSRFTGYDLSPQAMAMAQREAEARGLANVRFAVRDVTELGESASYDLITTFDAVHDQAHPAGVLRGIHEALRPGGAYLMQDIAASTFVEDNLSHPLGTLLYTISTMHCMTVSLARGGAGLGTMWGRELAECMLREAGFTDITVHSLKHDLQNEYTVCRKHA